MWVWVDFLPRFRRQLCENEWRYSHTVSDENVRYGLRIRDISTVLIFLVPNPHAWGSSRRSVRTHRLERQTGHTCCRRILDVWIHYSAEEGPKMHQNIRILQQINLSKFLGRALPDPFIYGEGAPPYSQRLSRLHSCASGPWLGPPLNPNPGSALVWRLTPELFLNSWALGPT